MAEKNYIESVTNLQRATVKYVPKDLLDSALRLLNDTLSLYSSEDGDDERIRNSILKRLKEAEEKTVDLYVLDTINGENSKPTIKRPINVCPYCGNTMDLRWTYGSIVGRRMSYDQKKVHFVCERCEAASPEVFLDLHMINEDEIAKSIGRAIDNAIWYRENEEEDEEED